MPSRQIKDFFYLPIKPPYPIDCLTPPGSILQLASTNLIELPLIVSQVMLDGVTATSPGAVIRTQLVVDSRGRCTAATAQTNGLTTNITPVPHPQLSPNPTTEGATTTTSIVVQSDPQQSASSTQNIDPPSSTVNNANAPGTGSGTQPNPLC